MPMRPRCTFVVMTNGELVSAIGVRGEAHALRAGLRLEMAYAYETDYGTVNEAARFCVAKIAEDDGTAWLMAEGIEPALYHWDNMLVISPFDTEDLLACLRLSIDKMVPVEQLVPEKETS
jgi:hypothetical protein